MPRGKGRTPTPYRKTRPSWYTWMEMDSSCWTSSDVTILHLRWVNLDNTLSGMLYRDIFQYSIGVFSNTMIPIRYQIEHISVFCKSHCGNLRWDISDSTDLIHYWTQSIGPSVDAYVTDVRCHTSNTTSDLVGQTFLLITLELSFDALSANPLDNISLMGFFPLNNCDRAQDLIGWLWFLSPIKPVDELLHPRYMLLIDFALSSHGTGGSSQNFHIFHIFVNNQRFLFPPFRKYLWVLNFSPNFFNQSTILLLDRWFNPWLC